MCRPSGLTAMETATSRPSAPSIPCTLSSRNESRPASAPLVARERSAAPSAASPHAREIFRIRISVSYTRPLLHRAVKATGCVAPGVAGTLEVVANPAPEDRALEGHVSRSFEARALGPLALGFAVSVGLLLLYGAWETSFGHLRYLAEHSWLGPETIGPRIALTVIVLTGFMV